MLLECVRWDNKHVTLRDIEGSAEFVCTHSFCKPALGALFYNQFVPR